MIELIWNELKEDWFIFSHNAVLVLAFILGMVISSCVGYGVGKSQPCDCSVNVEHVSSSY